MLTFILLILLIFITYITKDKIINTLTNTKTNDENKKAQDIIQQNEKYQKEEKLKQIEADRMKNIKTKKILVEQLNKTQKVNLIEGNLKWQNTIEKQAWIKLFNNNLNVELPFVYQIQYDISNIEVQYIDQGIVKIKANTNKKNFKILIALNTDNIKQNKDKESWMFVDFNSIDMQRIIKVAQEDIENTVANDKTICEKSKESLDEFLNNLMQQFGLECRTDYINDNTN